jgi:hypothetical protein
MYAGYCVTSDVGRRIHERHIVVDRRIVEHLESCRN